jgi:hypothetical protein
MPSNIYAEDPREENKVDRTDPRHYFAAPPRCQSISITLPNETANGGDYLMELLRKYYKAEEATEDNEQLFTDTALLQRESMRFNTKISSMLEKIWHWVDRDGSGDVDESEYIRLYHILVKIIWSHQKVSETSEQELRRMAHVDFENDCMGYDVLNKAGFMQAFFQLTDTWTDNITEDVYLTFLHKLYKFMIKLEPLPKPDPKPPEAIPKPDPKPLPPQQSWKPVPRTYPKRRLKSPHMNTWVNWETSLRIETCEAMGAQYCRQENVGRLCLDRPVPRAIASKVRSLAPYRQFIDCYAVCSDLGSNVANMNLNEDHLEWKQQTHGVPRACRQRGPNCNGDKIGFVNLEFSKETKMSSRPAGAKSIFVSRNALTTTPRVSVSSTKPPTIKIQRERGRAGKHKKGWKHQHITQQHADHKAACRWASAR